MSAASTETGVVLDTTGAAKPRRFLTRGTRFITEVFDGADEALQALEAIQGGLTSTGFQTLDWLTALYEELAPAKDAMPRLVVVTERNTGQIALVLPLLIKRKKLLNTARFADAGVSDYNAPILGPVFPTKPRSIRRTWRAVLRAMPDVDFIRLERMPPTIAGQPNPILTRFGRTPARHSGHVVIVEETVASFIASRGKKFRKEAERVHRVWQREGGTRFYRATTTAEIARVYSALEDQQAVRHAGLGTQYILDQPAYRSFYERIAIDGSEAGLTAIFALEAKGEIVATLFGIVHDGTFTLLRIATAGARWGHLSPGRLIVIEAMKHFVERGVRTFDFGIGDYPFKRAFGASEVPLYDLIIARELAALPRAMFHRMKGRLRKNSHVRAAFQHLRRYFGGR